MDPIDQIFQALRRKDATIILQGKYSAEELKRIFASAWEKADQSQFPNGISWNASFDDKHAEITIDYKGATPANPKPVVSPVETPKPQKPRQKTPEMPNPAEEPSKPKGFKGLLGRLFGGGSNDNHPTNPAPRTPKPNSKHISLENTDAPMPDPNAVVEIIDVGQPSFIGEILVDRGPSFIINTQDYNRVDALFRKEVPSYVVSSEGACNIQMRARGRGRMVQFFVDFNLGMKNEVFYDHLSKGRKNAKTTMYRLTHNGNMPVLMKIYLAYAFFQKEVHYNYEYAATQMKTPNGNMHMAYGPLVLKSAVCEGYSWALIHMLSVIGVPATICFGELKGRGSHAWVKIEYDGAIYNIDPTVDGSSPCIFLKNFLKSDAHLKNQGYVEKNPIYVASDTHYDDNRYIREFLEKERDAALRAGGDRAILSAQINIGG